MIDYLVDTFACIQEQLERLYNEAELKSDETQADTALKLARIHDELVVLESKLRNKF